MRTVLITGAAAGVGKAAAELFARDGWRCVLVDRDSLRLAAVRDGLGKGHVAVTADLTADPLALSLPDDLGRIDALVNNAGMSDGSGTGLCDKDFAALGPVMRLNLAAPMRLVEVLGQRLVPGARVVNVSSGAGLRAIPFRGAYSASKAGLIVASRALSRARPDLRVSVLCPGFVRTEMVEGLIAAGRLDPDRAVAKIPLGRMAHPEELAHALLFLAGSGGAALNGQVLSLDGGSSVYGGSFGFAPNAQAVLPLEAETELTIHGQESAPSLAALMSGQAGRYPAVIDATPLAADAEVLVEAVHASARRFAAAHGARASLTLLLPAPGGEDDVAGQGAGEAARMMVRTLACELADRALRINAVEVADPAGLDRLADLFCYVAGARAQFLTGQILTPERSART
ncbi:SDR family oxidoreductase [Seohaeicola zhoushanensis]|uniref:SDR family oxidoreductase n=1 Tax=Seohaeicola zhoushanensis TaxID=1569283 RepID=A0A8J3M778_9RHOB|nr:SDR family oxidoreductase [Seohaeicola zhoushanensis]GHF44957.1 hypothetical protein GCM10017056_15680 [Seohaeicola zhoushanensis]